MDAAQLLARRGARLEHLFTESPAGAIPEGRGRGTVLFAPGTWISRPVALLVRSLLWQGKVFDRAQGDLVNLVSPLRLRQVRADVYRGSSIFDQREAIVLDYSKTSRVARWIRDEIREVAPGVYLGLAFWAGHKVLKFVLVFPGAGGRP